jgi:uncharacterized membrane protein YczE
MGEQAGAYLMKVIFFILGLVVLAVAVAMSIGLISIDQTRSAMVQAPAFQANVGKVVAGHEEKTVTVPTLHVERADNAAAGQ